jgi:hypothetical protein
MTTLPHGVLGIKTADGTIVQVLDFGKQGESTTIFTTTVDRQSRARFDFFYREAVGTGWIYLDTIPLNRIPPARAGEPDLMIQARRNGRGDLLLGIEDPASPQPQLFQLDVSYLAGLCRQALAAPASERSSGRQGRSPLPGSGAAQDRGEHAAAGVPAPVPEPEAQSARAGKRGKAGWIAAPLLAGALVLLVLAIRPGGLVRKPDKAGPAGSVAADQAPGTGSSGERRQTASPEAMQAKRGTDSTGRAAASPTRPAPATTAGQQSGGSIPAAHGQSGKGASAAGEAGEQSKAAPAASMQAQGAAPAAGGKKTQEAMAAPGGQSRAVPAAGQIEGGPAQSAPVDSDWLPAGEGRELYKITWGDTLWRIAERFYGDRKLYPELAESNRLDDPDYIIAGESLVLPPAIKGREKKHTAE